MESVAAGWICVRLPHPVCKPHNVSSQMRREELQLRAAAQTCPAVAELLAQSHMRRGNVFDASVRVLVKPCLSRLAVVKGLFSLSEDSPLCCFWR